MQLQDVDEEMDRRREKIRERADGESSPKYVAKTSIADLYLVDEEIRTREATIHEKDDIAMIMDLFHTDCKVNDSVHFNNNVDKSVLEDLLEIDHLVSRTTSFKRPVEFFNPTTRDILLQHKVQGTLNQRIDDVYELHLNDLEVDASVVRNSMMLSGAFQHLLQTDQEINKLSSFVQEKDDIDMIMDLYTIDCDANGASNIHGDESLYQELLATDDFVAGKKAAHVSQDICNPNVEKVMRQFDVEAKPYEGTTDVSELLRTDNEVQEIKLAVSDNKAMPPGNGARRSIFSFREKEAAKKHSSSSLFIGNVNWK